MSIAKRFLVIIALVAIVVSLGLIGGGAVGRADDETQPLEAIELAAGAPLLVSYQGRLEDPATGNPKPDGTYGMTSVSSTSPAAARRCGRSIRPSR